MKFFCGILLVFFSSFSLVQALIQAHASIDIYYGKIPRNVLLADGSGTIFLEILGKTIFYDGNRHTPYHGKLMAPVLSSPDKKSTKPKFLYRHLHRFSVYSETEDPLFFVDRSDIWRPLQYSHEKLRRAIEEDRLKRREEFLQEMQQAVVDGQKRWEKYWESRRTGKKASDVVHAEEDISAENESESSSETSPINVSSDLVTDSLDSGEARRNFLENIDLSRVDDPDLRIKRTAGAQILVLFNAQNPVGSPALWQKKTTGWKRIGGKLMDTSNERIKIFAVRISETGDYAIFDENPIPIALIPSGERILADPSPADLWAQKEREKIAATQEMVENATSTDVSRFSSAYGKKPSDFLPVSTGNTFNRSSVFITDDAGNLVIPSKETLQKKSAESSGKNTYAENFSATNSTENISNNGLSGTENNYFDNSLSTTHASSTPNTTGDTTSGVLYNQVRPTTSLIPSSNKILTEKIPNPLLDSSEATQNNPATQTETYNGKNSAALLQTSTLNRDQRPFTRTSDGPPYFLIASFLALVIYGFFLAESRFLPKKKKTGDQTKN